MSYISSTTVGDTVIVWERNEHGDRVVRHFDAPFYFYYDDPNGEYRSMYNTPVSKYEAETASDLNRARQYYRTRNIRVWEGDIAPDIRVLSREYYGKPAPTPHVTFLDIENNYDEAIGYASIQNPYAEINAIALFHNWRKELVTIVVPPDSSWTLDRLKKEVAVVAPHAPLDPSLKSRFVMCSTEEELLVHFLREIQDSDILSGWNSELFDIPYLCQRIARALDGVDLNARVLPAETTERGKLRIPFEENPNPLIAKRCKFLRKMDFPKHGRLTYRTVAGEKGQLIGVAVDMIGRVHLDYMNLVKKYEPGERQSYKLATVSEQVLVDEVTGEPLLPKLKYEGSLARLYKDNFPMFVRYNMRDSEILWGFEQKLGYVELANQMAHISTSLFSDVTGTIKLADRALVNYLHHVKNRVAPTVTEPLIDRQIEGALVLYPQVGLHHKIGSIDINSLYPSVIRLINISPEMLRGQFERCAADMLEILAESTKLLNLVLEDGGHTITMTAAEWKQELLRRKWAVSGYGTVFDQSEEGFIPAILSEWYTERKRYQALKKEAESNTSSCNDPVAKTKFVDQISYYDRLQYVYKIKLNSLYGALSNLYFRFFDLRMGESTTGTGRMVLRHQCRQVSFELGHGYDVDFPMYYDVDAAMEKGYSREEAEQISLNGPKFKGSHQTNAVVYGDTDSVDGSTLVDIDGETDTVEQHFETLAATNMVLKDEERGVELLMLDGQFESPCIADEGWEYAPVNLIYRHKSTKRRFKITTASGKEVIVTEDHSLIRIGNSGELIDSTPLNCSIGDTVLVQSNT